MRKKEESENRVNTSKIRIGSVRKTRKNKIKNENL